MSIATFDDLLLKVPQWAERTDISEELITDFLYMAEAEASQQLRVPAMENAELLVVSNGSVTVPFDFLELRRLTWQGSEDKVLQYLSWDQFVNINQSGGVYQDTTTPTYFSRQGANWFISPEPADDTNILCHYYRYVPAIGPQTSSNWLLDLSPQVYLYGGLKYLHEYVMDNERATYWEQKFMNELQRLQTIADRAEHMGTHLAIRYI